VKKYYSSESLGIINPFTFFDINFIPRGRWEKALNFNFPSLTSTTHTRLLTHKFLSVHRFLLPLSIYALLFIYGFVEGGSKNGKNLNKFVKVDIDSLNIDGKWKFWFDGEKEVRVEGD
jgi:hypothetical protein